ncbi:MAG TPA: DUF488 domain-containing protein [Candidatus Sulfotelmatobacter sp.]|nr:DUF488 domain-containing protein [Candidatus Sulfotelmatobacter sp.]
MAGSEPIRLITLGHGTAGQDELAALLREAELDALVDVRTVPKSRRHPHVWREELERWVPALTGVAYRWEPRLGGFRKPDPNSSNVALRHPAFRAYADAMEKPPFQLALDELLAQAAASRTAIMCSESLWWRCHRRLIADAAQLLHGTQVEHLMHDGTYRPHVPTAGVRVTDEGTLRYDVLFAGDEAGDPAAST